jgi:isopentenyldiphosphate isomerase
VIVPEEEEVFEIVDEAGRVIGTAPRSRCHGDPSLAHRSVHVFVFNGRGDLYLQKRSTRKDIQPGKWDTSVGGHLRPGESYLEAARRELEEELGVSGVAAAGLGWLHGYIWRTSVETEHVQTYRLVFGGPFSLHIEEIEEGRFWTREEIRHAIGTGVFTPNLEHELGLIGVASP